MDRRAGVRVNCGARVDVIPASGKTVVKPGLEKRRGAAGCRGRRGCGGGGDGQGEHLLGDLGARVGGLGREGVSSCRAGRPGKRARRCEDNAWRQRAAAGDTAPGIGGRAAAARQARRISACGRPARDRGRGDGEGRRAARLGCRRGRRRRRCIDRECQVTRCATLPSRRINRDICRPHVGYVGSRDLSLQHRVVDGRGRPR